MNSSFSAVHRSRIADGNVATTEHRHGFHAGATPDCADTVTEPSAIPYRRDESASHRDQAARERDELAARRDEEADTDDATALELEGPERSPLDRRTWDVRRTHDAEGREQASLGRERAKQDRALAAIDRELGERDREASRLDREHAGTDELTGARRRGVGLEDLQREIDRAHRTGENLVAAYVDVDGLKAVNDQHGHHAGDQLLQDVVEVLRRDMRSYDLLIRLGGDEFLCVMPGLTSHQARRRFEHLETALPPGPTLRSLSFGLSELRDGEGPSGLIERADQNLISGRGAR
jgi:diguanylate cyclase (GGDEF)-like protein